MAGNSLPDEIISEILSPALQVPDHKFADIGEESPFAEYAESPSAYLLVCKAWLRVATPLLYNVVVIRSKAQAKALAQALLKNKDLGQFIKRLRVEGGYGAPMRTILQSSPNISDLSISLNIFSSDSTSGLCAGLPLVNPTRLIFQICRKTPANQMVTKLVTTLRNLAPNWDRLSVLKIPSFLYQDELLESLNEMRTIHTLVVPSLFAAAWFFRIFKDSPLRCVQVTEGVSGDLEGFLDNFKGLEAMIRFTKEERAGSNTASSGDLTVAQIGAPSNPEFIPMEAARTEVKEFIWKRILYFALSVPELEEEPESKIPPQLPILLVSKYFNRLALPYYYAHIILTKYGYSSNLVSVVERNPWLGSHIRTIVGELDESYVVESDYSSDDDSEAAQRVRARRDLAAVILSQTTGLEALLSQDVYSPGDTPDRSDGGISWEALEIALETCGSTLQKLATRICAASSPMAPIIFSRFTALKSLVWECKTLFDLDEIPSAALPCLTDLTLAKFHPSFVVALTRMELPSLRTLVLCEHETEPTMDFLRSHGNKVVDLTCSYGEVGTKHIFELCPNIKILGLYLPHPNSPTLKVTTSFVSENVISSTLGKVVLHDSYLHRNPYWETLFLTLNSRCFPSLREIQGNGCQWPTNERDIAKSPWVRWAEILAKKDISLADYTGKKWRVRLKVVK
ncbi:hypothetical protein FB45DRAFT_1009632 [Roridomyces roridus]|uniref:F-box domain-containing protein n=1 Tax=Roridomyces roridus TaxID=1738132 RepID=A0AAD7B741_9AGAR|nr:hypothetical protein FB45DRAFT_1009632 [Roridomyces roridus]